jgi:hypothetical protein
MTPAAFLPQVEAALRSRCVPFDAGQLRAFVEGARGLIADDLDAAAWAAAFLQAQRLARVTGARVAAERN